MIFLNSLDPIHISGQLDIAVVALTNGDYNGKCSLSGKSGKYDSHVIFC